MPIACDARRAPDATDAGREEGGCVPVPPTCRLARGDLRGLSGVARRATAGRQGRVGADAGRGGAQRSRLDLVRLNSAADMPGHTSRISRRITICLFMPVRCRVPARVLFQ